MATKPKKGAVGTAPTFGAVPEMAPPHVGGGVVNDLMHGADSFLTGLQSVRDAKRAEALQDAAAQLAERRVKGEEDYRKGELGTKNRDLDIRERELSGNRASYEAMVPGVEAEIQRLTGKPPAPLPPGVRGQLAYSFRMDQLNAAQALVQKRTDSPTQANGADSRVRAQFERQIAGTKTGKKNSTMMKFGSGKQLAPEEMGVVLGGIPDLNHQDSVSAMKRTRAVFRTPEELSMADRMSSELGLNDGAAPASKTPAEWVAEVRAEHPEWAPAQIAAEAKKRAGVR